MQNPGAAKAKNQLRIYLDLVANGACGASQETQPSIPPEQLAAKQREVRYLRKLTSPICSALNAQDPWRNDR